MVIRLVKLSTNLRSLPKSKQLLAKKELCKLDSISDGQVPALYSCQLNSCEIRLRNEVIALTRTEDVTMTSIENDIDREPLCYRRKRISYGNSYVLLSRTKSSVLLSAFINVPTQINTPKFNPISRHMSSHKSLSSVKMEQLQEIDGVNIDDVIRSEIEDINEMIVLRKLGVSVIHEIYEAISKLILLLGIPTINTKESDKNFFVGTVLFSIAAFIRKECRCDLYVRSEAPLKDFNINIKGRMDFVVTDGKRKLVVIECKRHNADFGLVQCILALKHMYDTNNDGADTYGFTTNGLEWRFVKYNGNRAMKVKVFEKQTLITTYMHLPKRKERWLEHNTLMLHIIYSAILSAVEVNRPLMLENAT